MTQHRCCNAGRRCDWKVAGVRSELVGGRAEVTEDRED